MAAASNTGSDRAARITLFNALNERTGNPHTACHFFPGNLSINPSCADHLPQQRKGFRAVPGICAVAAAWTSETSGL